jgi:hypothetical protein
MKKKFKYKMVLLWMRTDRYRQKEKKSLRWILRSRRSTSPHRLIRCIQFIFTFPVCYLAFLYGFYSVTVYDSAVKCFFSASFCFNQLSLAMSFVGFFFRYYDNKEENATFLCEIL